MDTEEEIKDIIGQRVDIGDVLAVGFRHGSTAAMRIGRVIGFGSRKRYPGTVTTIEIDWSIFKNSVWAPGVSQIESDNGRFLKVIIPLDTIS